MHKRRLTCALLAAAALAAGAQPASADTLVPAGELTNPGGVTRTSNGSLWVSDALHGVCRVSDAGTLVIDEFCMVEAHDPTLPEVPAAGPADVMDLVFDEASKSFYGVEGGGAAGGVWRYKWNELTDEIIDAQKIVTTGGDRVFGLDVHRTAPTLTDLDGKLELDYVSKRSQVVRRIPDASALFPASPITVGTATAPDVVDVARLGDALYLAEAAGVSVIQNPGASDRNAVALPAFAGQLPGALAADDASGRLYVGTNNAVGFDEVVVHEPATGRTEPYAGGLAGISAVTVDDDGSLLVGDDPATASGAVDAQGGGRIMRFEKLALGRASVALTAAPAPVIPTASVTFNYTSADGATFECRLDSPTWSPCPGTGSGSATFGADTPLADGPHEFAVRAIDGSGPGQALRHAFTVDTVAPSVTIDQGAEDRVVEGPNLDLSFSASESAAFACSIDGAAPTSCDSPLRLRGLALGDHQVVVTATDLAGHASNAADPLAAWQFTVVPAPVEPPKQDNSGKGSDESDNSGSSGPRAVPELFGELSRRPGCKGTVSTKLDLRRKPAAVSVVFPAELRPRRVRMVIGKLVGKRVKTVVGMDRAIEGSPKCANVIWGLWKDEGRRLRKGKYVLTVVAGSNRRTMKHVYRGPLRVIR